MLTIFTIPKPFAGHIGMIQRNALGSWLRLRGQCQIILCGDDPGVAEAAAEFGLRHIGGIAVNAHGSPRLDDLFARAQAAAEHPLLSYVNTDIILPGDFLQPLEEIPWRRFLMIGRRWDLDVAEPLDFADPQWESKLRQAAQERGHLHEHTGVDFFTFPKGLWGTMPPFAVGRGAYDNWWIFRARQMGVPVIDATPRIFCVHQNHERTYRSLGRAAVGGEQYQEGPERDQNVELAGGWPRLFTSRDATWLLTPQGLRRALTPWRLRRHPYAWLVLHPRLYRFARRLRRLLPLGNRAPQ